MDILDSPLNQAHQQSRKADRFVKSGRYEEAIECHKKASEFLTKAMVATTIQQALQSFSLQREHHIRQQALIREKQRRHLQALNKSSGTMLASCKLISEEHSASCGSENDLTAGDKQSSLRSLQETSSLLHFLNNYTARCKEPGQHQDELSYKYQPKLENIPLNKSDKQIQTELCIQNEALRNHVLELLKEAEESNRQISYLQRELDYSRKENRDLKDRLSKSEHSPRQEDLMESMQIETFYSMPMGLNLDRLPVLDLPPLEKPKFDFDSIKVHDDLIEGSPSQ